MSGWDEGDKVRVDRENSVAGLETDERRLLRNHGSQLDGEGLGMGCD